MPTTTEHLRIKLGRVATGTMSPGNTALTALGFSALPWEGSGTPLLASDVGTEVTVIGAGPNMPVVPAFGPVGEMLITTLSSWSDATSGNLAAAASNDTEPGAANVTVYREIDWKIDSLRVEWSLTSIARSTMTFTVDSLDGSMVGIEGMPVLLKDDVLGVLWGGSVDSVEITNEVQDGGPITFQFSCVSWAALLDRRPIDPYVLTGGIFGSLTLQDTMRHLVYDYCDSEGLSVDCPVGPTISLNVSGAADKTVAQAADDAMALSNDPSNTYIWYVDPWKVVTAKLAQTTAAPWHVSDADHTDADILLKVDYKRNRSKLVNHVYLLCTCVLTATDPETYAGDGTRKDFTVTKPIGVTPTITVNGVGKTVGIANGGVAFDWYWSRGSNTVTQDVGGATLTSGNSLVVSYQAMSTQLFTAENITSIDRQLSIESGTGISGQKVTYDSPVLLADAPALAQLFADRLAFIPKEITVVTRRSGLGIGQSFSVTLGQFFLPTLDYLIDSVTLTSEQGELRWEIHCVNGPTLGAYLTAFASMAGGGSSGSSIGGGFSSGSGGTTTPTSGVTLVPKIFTANYTFTGPDPAIGGLLVIYGMMDGTGGWVVDFDPSVFQWPPDVDTAANVGFTQIFVSQGGKWVSTALGISGRKA